MSEQTPPQVGEIRKSSDGRTFAWTGQGWVPVAWTGESWTLLQGAVVRRRRLPVWSLLIGALFLIGVGFAIAQNAGPQDANAQRGVTNLTWSVAAIKFDYRASRTCTVKFHYVFLDDQGNVIDEADDVNADSVNEGDQYHITIEPATVNDTVPGATHRIDITPNCQ